MLTRKFFLLHHIAALDLLASVFEHYTYFSFSLHLYKKDT